jgi:hypothetical protein
MPGKTLILCYDFPPNQGIGGRRWAKLAKGLAQRGTDIIVLKADTLTGNVESAWTKDTLHTGIKVYSIPRNYPEILHQPSGSILGKLRFRYYQFLLRKKFRGTIFDLALCWEKDLIQQATDLIHKENIQNIIATGAPFNLLYQTSKLKTIFPKINCIIDYRDPWLTAVNYGIPQLKYDDFLYEKYKQYSVFQAAEHVICPNPFMLDEIRKSGDQLNVKAAFSVLPHFYDPDEISQYLSIPRQNDGKIRLVYGGTLYMGMEPYFKQLSEGLTLLKTKRNELYNQLEIELYSKDSRFSVYFESHTSVVKLSAPIGNSLFERLSQSDAAFIFLAHHNKHYQTTKFFEYLPFQKPFIYLGEQGYVAKFIRDEKLGYILDNPATDFMDIIEKIAEFKQDKQHLHEAWSLESVTAKLEKLMV